MKGNSSAFLLSKPCMRQSKRAHRKEIFRILSGSVKIHQIPLSNLKPQVIVMRDNSTVLFQLKIYMIWTTGTHQNAKFQIFDCSREISPNLYFDRLLSLKLHKISSKKRIEELCPMTLASDANFVKKTTICCFKSDKNLLNFDLSSRNSQNFLFDQFLLCKVNNV